MGGIRPVQRGDHTWSQMKASRKTNPITSIAIRALGNEQESPGDHDYSPKSPMPKTDRKIDNVVG